MTFEEYVAERGQALMHLAYVLSGDAHLAQDLVQSALVDAYRHWPRVAAADHPDAYVRRILVNAHLSRLRRRSSTERPSVLAEGSGLLAPDPADGVVARDHTRRMLGGLAPRARTVLVLRYYADLDDAAIAHHMGITPSTVRATASRALTALRQDLPLDAVEEER